MPDNGGFLVEKFLVPLFGRQSKHIIDPPFVFFQMFLQYLNGIIFLRTTPISAYLYVIPVNSKEFAISYTL